MQEIQATEAKAHLSALLRDVEMKSSAIKITRHGKTVAWLMPGEVHNQSRAKAAAERIKKRREEAKRVTVAELLSAKHEGHNH